MFGIVPTFLVECLIICAFSVSAADAAEAIDATNLNFIVTAAPGTPLADTASTLESDPEEILQTIYQTYQNTTAASLPSKNGCSSETITIRKEWNNLTPSEQNSWIQAMKCMNDRPSQIDPSIAPGARSRYDDFTVAHIISTPTVHFSPWLLLWHRHYIWIFEKAMQEECGYVGGLPYGDWLKYDATGRSGIWATIGGDGVQSEESNCTCVQDGPFSDWVVNLGPTGRDDAACSNNPTEDGLSYNPRCLERKFDASLMANMSAENVASTIMDSPDVDAFGPRLDIWPRGLHALPHTFVGGLQGAIPASSHDPWFFTHHGCLDRLYSLWVNMDVDNRLGILPDLNVYAAIRSDGWSDPPPLRLDSTLYISPVFENVTVRDVISTTDGLYCYMYE